MINRAIVETKVVTTMTGTEQEQRVAPFVAALWFGKSPGDRGPLHLLSGVIVSYSLLLVYLNVY